MQSLIEEIRLLTATVRNLEQKIDMHFSPTGQLTIRDEAEAMARALRSGDKAQIKAARKLVCSSCR